MTLRSTPLWQRVAAASGLVITSPLLAVSAAAIKLSSPGPVIYRSTRAGRGRKPFSIYKLRTMHVGSDTFGSITSTGDPRVFPAGRWLRRLKFDELPQLANVVRGEMALVGPRPEAIDIVEHAYQPWMMETLDVPPGITGPASLHYFQQERTLPQDPTEATAVYIRDLLPQKLALELVYVRSRSLSYELQLLFRTAIGIVGARDLMQGAGQRELVESERILHHETKETAS